MDSALHLRPMEPADLPAVMRLMAETPQAPSWREEDYHSFLGSFPPDARRHRRAWVLCAGGTLAGFAGASLLAAGGVPECELEFIAIAPEHRRQGGGARLLKTVLEWARDAGAPTVQLEVRGSNLNAIHLYQRHGFRVVGRRPGYYREPEEDAVLMDTAVDAGSPPVVL